MRNSSTSKAGKVSSVRVTGKGSDKGVPKVTGHGDIWSTEAYERDLKAARESIARRDRREAARVKLACKGVEEEIENIEAQVRGVPVYKRLATLMEMAKTNPAVQFVLDRDEVKRVRKLLEDKDGEALEEVLSGQVVRYDERVKEAYERGDYDSMNCLANTAHMLDTWRKAWEEVRV